MAILATEDNLRHYREHRYEALTDKERRWLAVVRVGASMDVEGCIRIIDRLAGVARRYDRRINTRPTRLYTPNE